MGTEARVRLLQHLHSRLQIEEPATTSVDRSFKELACSGSGYLNGQLEESIFVRQAPGFKLGIQAPDNPHHEAAQNNHGLRPSPNVWDNTIDKKLSSIGFNPAWGSTRLSRTRVCTRKEATTHYATLALFVDDTLVTGSSDVIVA